MPTSGMVAGHIAFLTPLFHLVIPALFIHDHDAFVRQPTAQTVNTLLIPLQQTYLRFIAKTFVFHPATPRRHVLVVHLHIKAHPHNGSGMQTTTVRINLLRPAAIVMVYLQQLYAIYRTSEATKVSCRRSKSEVKVLNLYSFLKPNSSIIHINTLSLCTSRPQYRSIGVDLDVPHKGTILFELRVRSTKI